MEISPLDEETCLGRIGTLAIDLGNSTTVVAFQGENDKSPELLELPPISRFKGEVPSLIYSSPQSNTLIVGQAVIEKGLAGVSSKNLIKNFKRQIGAKESSDKNQQFPELSPEKAGELLLEEIWRRIPETLKIRRLVLTAPIDTYIAYKEWLLKVCRTFKVKEIALVDEPTAAAMGAGLDPGAKLLVLDIGGSTIDMSLVALEGGEGHAAPIAELLRFDNVDLQGKSKQILRCAKVLGKAGIRLGGNDLDKWIANHLLPNEPLSEPILIAAEKLKCRLSENDLSPIDRLNENVGGKESHLNLELCRDELEKLLIERGLLNSLDRLFAETMAGGRRNNCGLRDLQGVVIVGGGARIPLIKTWLEKQTQPAALLTPPPIEAVAVGALKLTPGVTIKDILQYGVSLRFWDKKAGNHFWHPLFIAGQPWPTTAPLEVVISASKVDQSEIELVLGEPEITERNQVIYINGIPTIQEGPLEPKVNPFNEKPTIIFLSQASQPGEDCMRLKFSINEQANLIVEAFDLRSDEHKQIKNLGKVR